MEGLPLLVLTRGAIEVWGHFIGLAQPSGQAACRPCIRAGRCRRQSAECCPAGKPVGGRERTVSSSTSKLSKQNPGPPLRPTHRCLPPPDTSNPNKNTKAVCSDHGSGPGACAAWQRLLPIRELGEKGLLMGKKKKEPEKTEEVDLSLHIRASSLDSWTISPPMYPRFGVSIHFSGERMHSLYQNLGEAQGPQNGSSQAVPNS